MHRAGRSDGIGNVIVVGQLLCLYGHGVGHVVYQMHAGKVSVSPAK